MKKQNRRLFFLINMAQHYMFKRAKAECQSRFGISATQVGAILYIDKHAGCLQKDLANALGLEKPAVTGLVGRMEKNGLITRQPSETDSRAMQLFLSAQAKQHIPEILPMIQQLNAQLLDDFSAEEADVIFRFLNNMISKLK